MAFLYAISQLFIVFLIAFEDASFIHCLSELLGINSLLIKYDEDVAEDVFGEE